MARASPRQSQSATSRTSLGLGPSLQRDLRNYLKGDYIQSKLGIASDLSDNA